MRSAWSCYKYRSASAAFRSLSEGSLYFASAQQLNDLLEAKFDFAAEQNYLDTFHLTIRDMAARRGMEAKPAFATRLSKSKEFKEAHGKANNLFRALCERAGIFSAAARHDNQPMWAYYCNNSQGVCFHLEWPEEVINRYQLIRAFVHYTREARVHNRADDLRGALLDLERNNPTWSMAQLTALAQSERFTDCIDLRSIGRALSTKHADWGHEQEIRLIAPRSGSLPVLSDVLKTVIFNGGKNFPERDSIINTLRQSYPYVAMAKVEFSHREPFVTTVAMELDSAAAVVNARPAGDTSPTRTDRIEIARSA